MDDISWRSLPYDLNTHLPISSTTENPISKDKCEPLYVLIYAHCFMWFLFLVSYFMYFCYFVIKFVLLFCYVFFF